MEVSPNEGDGVTWDEKFARCRELGVEELVRFDPEAPEGKRLRAWDLVRGDLVERVIGDDRTPCPTLGLNWTVCPIPKQSVGLRLIDDEGVPRDRDGSRGEGTGRCRGAR